MSRVLVLDGEQRAALAVVRSLGRAGFEVHVASSDPRSLAGGSRWCAREVQLSDPLQAPQTFADDVKQYVSRERPQVVLPISEAALLALLPERHSVAPAVIPFPDTETFRAICDKERVLAAAREVGIQVPAQRIAATRADLHAMAAALKYPVVLKPSRSVGGNGTGRRKFGVVHARSAAALEDAAASLPEAAYPILVQDRIIGDGVGVFLLMWDGRVVAQFAHRRLREKPPSGGVSVYRESIVPDPALVDRSRALLERFAWSGVAMVEYKVERESGEAFLMEINGRFWGSLQLAIDAGVDFPVLLVKCGLGEPLPAAPPAYRTGVRSRWWWGDVDHLFARMRRSREELGLTRDEPTRLGALLRFFTIWRPGDRSEIFRLRDPLPFVRESREWLRALSPGRSARAGRSS